jgi:hypothetical protein
MSRNEPRYPSAHFKELPADFGTTRKNVRRVSLSSADYAANEHGGTHLDSPMDFDS